MSVLRSYFWLTNMAGVIGTFIFAPGLWAQFSMLYLVLISLWSNHENSKQA